MDNDGGRKRFLLKLSGEALMGDREFGIDPHFVERVAAEIAEVVRLGHQMAIVVGGGNLFRGVKLAAGGMDRVSADHMGMLATVMNGVALNAALKENDTTSQVFSGLDIPKVCESFTQRSALAALERGEVAIFVAGTGSPYFTTDTGAVLRAAEMKCDVLLKGTQVDGIYTVDPKMHADAEYLAELTYDEALARGIAVMDTAAMALARDASIEIVVFSLHQTGAISDVVAGRGRYSVVRAN